MTKTQEPKLSVDDKELQLVKAQFRNLQSDPAWIRIVEFLDRKIDIYRKQLEDDEFDSVGEVKRIQDRLRLCTQFRNTPEIIEGMQELVQGQKIDFDPYE